MVCAGQERHRDVLARQLGAVAKSSFERRLQREIVRVHPCYAYSGSAVTPQVPIAFDPVPAVVQSVSSVDLVEHS